jgi:acetolactate decarboxylase
MPTLTCEISDALSEALDRRSRATGESTSDFVSRALRRALDKPLHTLFQISTSRALVHGVYEEAVSTGRLLNHGDFGLGTFDELDGEMVILDGTIYQICSDGTVRLVDANVGTPFATVLNFSADGEMLLQDLKSLAELCDLCDRKRQSDNLFYAFRVDGLFKSIHTRAMRRTQGGVSLTAAASVQPEFHFTDIKGTLVGFWSPPYASAVDIPGYHFHFISADRTKGGHLLDCSGENVNLHWQSVRDFHLSLPDTEEFLRSDLTADVSKDLSDAEGTHSKENS